MVTQSTETAAGPLDDDRSALRGLPTEAYIQFAVRQVWNDVVLMYLDPLVDVIGDLRRQLGQSYS